MSNESNFRRIAFAAARGLSLAAVLHAGAAHAKVSAAPGADGAPPDPQTEAAVDELNDLISDGPQGNQTFEDWMAEVEAARDALTTTVTMSTAPTIVDEGDMCESPISLWTDSTSTQTVKQALGTSGLRNELTNNLEEYLYGQLYSWFFDSGVVFGAPQITSLSCTQCTMTYVDCLLAGNPVDWCKRHALNCPVDPRSQVTVALAVTKPVSGNVTLHANVRYREVDDPERPLPFDYCVDVESFETEGFGVFDGLVRDGISDVASTMICEQAWDWSY